MMWIIVGSVAVSAKPGRLARRSTPGMLPVARAMWGIPVLIAGVAACSSSSSSSESTGGGDAGDEGVIGCNGDSRAQNYAPGMAQEGKSGVFKLVLEKSMPAPASAGSSLTWTLRILDASGKPVDGATFPVLHAWMPLHGHGTAQVTVTPSGSGTYTLSPLYFYMPGLWETDLTVQSGTAKDSASFFFCMQ
jgi:hypothetical protein